MDGARGRVYNPRIMFGAAGAQSPVLVDLRSIREDRLAALLEEETHAWSQRLHWNFRPSADLVRRYVGMRALDGLALLDDGEPVGYSYFVAEDRKGLVGDLYVRERLRSPERERLLLDGVVDAMLSNPHIRRVEAQLMMLNARALQPARHPQSYERHFLEAPLDGAGRLPVRPGSSVLYEPWSMRWMDDAARLIGDVYRDHVDSRINDQYRSLNGARRFLQNIIQYPGCGQFHQPSSWIALDAVTGRLVGISLSSLVAPATGHITQICVDSNQQGRGVGYELMRRTMTSMVLARCLAATLTVTAANHQALALYHRLGFRLLQRFDALVWESA